MEPTMKKCSLIYLMCFILIFNWVLMVSQVKGQKHRKAMCLPLTNAFLLFNHFYILRPFLSCLPLTLILCFFSLIFLPFELVILPSFLNFICLDFPLFSFSCHSIGQWSYHGLGYQQDRIMFSKVMVKWLRYHQPWSWLRIHLNFFFLFLKSDWWY